MSSVDYCFTEVMVAIGEDYWRCITCQVQFTRHMSIDKHVLLKHGSSTSLSDHSVISCNESTPTEKTSSDSITAFSLNITSSLNGTPRLENCVNNTAKAPLHSRNANKHAVLFSGSESVKTVVDLPSIQILSESRNRIGESETSSHVAMENDHLWVRSCPSSFSDNDLNQTSVNEVTTDLNVLHDEQHAVRDPSQITDSHRKRENFEHDRIDEDLEGDEANKNMVDSLLGVLEKSMDIDGLGGVMQSWELNPELFEQQLLNNTSDISIDSLNTSSKEKTNGDSLLSICRKSPDDSGDHLPDDREPDNIVAESGTQSSSGFEKCNNAKSIDGLSTGSLPHSLSDSNSNSEVYGVTGDDSPFEVEQLHSLLDSDSSGSISSSESSSDSDSADGGLEEEVKCNSFASAGKNKTIVNQFAGFFKTYLKLYYGKAAFMDQPFHLKYSPSKNDSSLGRDAASSNEKSSLTSLSPKDFAGTLLSTLPDIYECDMNILNPNTAEKTISPYAKSHCNLSHAPHNRSSHSSSLCHALTKKTTDQEFTGGDINQTVLCDGNKLLMKDNNVNMSRKQKEEEKVKSNLKEKYSDMSQGNGWENKMEKDVGRNKCVEQIVCSPEDDIYSKEESTPSTSKRKKSEVETGTQFQGICKKQVECFSDKDPEAYKGAYLPLLGSVSKMKYQKPEFVSKKRKRIASLTDKQLLSKDYDKSLALSNAATSLSAFKSKQHCARRRQRKHTSTRKLSGCDIRNLRQEALISLTTKSISCTPHKMKRAEEKRREDESKDENRKISHQEHGNTSLTDVTSSHDLITMSKEAEVSPVFTATAEGSSHLCNICDRRFSTSSARNRHLKVNSMSSDTCKCKVCSMKFHSLLQLNIHIYRTHETQGRPICFKCNSQHSTLRNLTRHIQKHKNELVLEQMKQQPFSTKALKTWKCDICGIYFRNCESVILAHTRKHTKERPHECTLCDKKFSTVAALNVHAATHSGRMYHCDLCDQAFKNKTSRHYHKLTHASVKGEFLCQVCGQMFEFQHKLTSHVKVHSQPKKIRPTFKCTDCDKVYKSKKNLVRHVEVDHKGIKDYDYKCEHCDQQFFASWQLRDHITWRHLGEKPYHCAYCGQGFVCRPTLIRHQRNVHTGVKPYKCQFCEEAFVEKKNLDLHEAKVHTGIYPLSCSHCGKGFVVSSSLKAHEAMHLDERPHQCHLCGKRFLKANHLTRHSKGCAKRNGPISFVYSMGRLSHDSLAPAAPPLPIMTGEAMAASIYSL